MTNQNIHDQLRENAKELINFVSTIDPSIINQKPSPDQWSIMQICDHLISTEFGILSMLSTEGIPAASDRISKLDTIKVTAPDRTRKAKAPAMLEPKGKTDTPEKFCTKIESLRNKMISASEKKDLKQICNAFPHFVFGELTFEEWLHFSIAHANRHKEQMEEYAKQLANT